MRSKGYSRKIFLKLLKDDDFRENEETRQLMLRVCSELWNCWESIPANAKRKLDKLFQSYFDDYEKSPSLGSFAQAARRIKTILDGACSKRYKIRRPPTDKEHEEEDEP